MSSFSECLSYLLSSDPDWLNNPAEFNVCALQCLNHQILKSSASRFALSAKNKPAAVSGIVNRAISLSSKLIALNDEELFRLSPSIQCTSRLRFITSYFESCFGTDVAIALRFPCIQFPPPPFVLPSDCLLDFPWMALDYSLYVSRFCRLTLPFLKSILSKLHPTHVQAYRSSSNKSCADALLRHIWQTCAWLCISNDRDFAGFVFSLLPTMDDQLMRNECLTVFLKHSYGVKVVELLCMPLAGSVGYGSFKSKAKRRADKLLNVKANHARIEEISSLWPSPASQDVVFRCLHDYLDATKWKLPPPCAVCSRHRIDLPVQCILFQGPRKTFPLPLDVLELNDSYILSRCVPECLPDAFVYDFFELNGIMLYKPAVHCTSDKSASMIICRDCHSSLVKKKMPKFALANKLYRGELPPEFKDLTWVEEMVCAKFRNTAYITRLFGSTDPALPLVLHGNTCAHDMNVISTASVLPRTPADVNDMLSVVFIGPGKLQAKHLKNLFRVRKKKVWGFLIWLQRYNILYSDIVLDPDILSQYPDDDCIPGLEERVVLNDTLNPKTVFNQEAAAFSEHPADLVINEANRTSDDNTPFIFLEKMGVSDPEGDKISGRTFIASALRNLIPMNVKEHSADLILHRSSSAVNEYNNPQLLPGMYPTLFPLGIGGAEDSTRLTKLSFHNQVPYYFDLPDRSFRYHHSYMFVTLNIIQRRAAHLHTSFAVKKNRFHTVANKLVALTPEVLNSTAKHLEQEGHYSDLDDKQKEAVSLIRELNTIGARIPGSEASKIFTRNEIRSYFGYFGMPHLYFTANPNASHSPIFQVMAGDVNVDLTKRYPFLVPGKERALRLAQDPVAAADFFEFSIKTMFEHLFGWDYEKRCSKSDGGILGHLRAFYGCAENTERGGLHGHFVMWLVGGLNPSELHERMKQDDAFQQKFFDFFEGIIHHHLPDIDVQLDKSFEPRTQRPPCPPVVFENTPVEILNEWESVFVTEIKKCGEVLQRHTHRPVCEKYGNEGKCRFLFPHEIVDASYFDPDTNSVVLMCRDGNVNYFNPYILVFCRHNHDLKCILSGKAAKAAMFYITDYITKMDIKTYEMLSLMSRAVSNMSDLQNSSTKDHAKVLLHKCLAQFSRQQQIHAQQAARYLRGHKDGIPSHDTIPMLSSLLLNFIQSLYPVSVDAGIDNDDEEDIEQTTMRIAIGSDGKLFESNQVHDYYYRDDSLKDMNFFHFAQCVSLEKKTSKQPVNDPESHMGVLHRHDLLVPHPLAETHHLIEHTNEERGEGQNEYIPRVIGSSIPRSNAGRIYKIFVLAHLKPFGVNNPLIPESKKVEDVFQTYQFSSKALTIMKNWDAIHECEDARDAERLRKRAALTTKSQAFSDAIKNGGAAGCENVDFDNHSVNTRKAKKDFEVSQAILLLQQSQWFKFVKSLSNHSSPHQLPIVTDALLKRWKTSIKEQELIIKHARQNGSEVHNQINLLDKTMAETESHTTPVTITANCPDTDVPNIAQATYSSSMNSQSIIEDIASSFQFNQKQQIAFEIAAKCFVESHTAKKAGKIIQREPMRLLLTGPGGTGKTHVVKGLRAVMAAYGCEHKIRFLAPTGSAAALIDGMTIHKGLGIKIHSNDKGKGSRKLGENKEDYSVIITIQNRTVLRTEWKDVEVLLLDEVSLLAQQLNCEIDHALRYATERPDEWYGGIQIIFAGDFYQYPPIGGTALYTPISQYSAQTNKHIEQRLGRLAWKTVNMVVTLTEQERMKKDPEYGHAVNRLRTRQCGLDDVELFNSRVVMSASNEHGINMSIDGNDKACAIVNTNLLRETINMRKASAICSSENGPQLLLCAAHDQFSPKPDRSNLFQEVLNFDLSSLSSTGSLPGFVPLYIGMPIILRNKNIATELGITNGAQGIVRQINTKILPTGVTFCTSAIVEFPTSKVHLTGLPEKFFPITPITWSFTTLLQNKDGEKISYRITRHQLPIQPAFAVTGQSAQGKTLPKVLVNLHEGGFAAYVGVSRAQTREGLCISKPVTLEMLNKPVPHDLYAENKRFEAIEHNTLIKFGYLQGVPVPVPDPETEKNLKHGTLRPKFITDEITDEIKNLNGNSKKRKANKQNDGNKPKRKHNSNGSVAPYFAGCVWSSQNYSCAYDSAFMCLYTIYITASPLWKTLFKNNSRYSTLLANNFQALINLGTDVSSADFNKFRDAFRDELSELNSTRFPRWGPALIDIADVFAAINLDSLSSNTLQCQFLCHNTCNSTNLPGYSINLPHLCHPTLSARHHETDINLPFSFDVQLWLTRLVSFRAERLQISNNIKYCTNCELETQPVFEFVEAPPFWHFEVPSDITHRLTPSELLIIPHQTDNLTYRLSSIVYLGELHFCIRFIGLDDKIWIYDGQMNGGKPFVDTATSLNKISDLQTYGEKVAYVYVYKLQS
jgi:ATP-dependent exoDNAse (exonuclease V) alpha subunit